MTRNRRNFTEEFKREAVNQCLPGGLVTKGPGLKVWLIKWLETGRSI